MDTSNATKVQNTRERVRMINTFSQQRVHATSRFLPLLPTFLPREYQLTHFNNIFFSKIWWVIKKCLPLHHENETSRGGAVVARWAHNPKVAGSSPVPATSDEIARSHRPGDFFAYPYPTPAPATTQRRRRAHSKDVTNVRRTRVQGFAIRVLTQS